MCARQRRKRSRRSAPFASSCPCSTRSAASLPLIGRLRPVLDRLGLDWQVIFVDDGSTDGTLAGLKALNAQDARIKAVALSRNFGKEIAIAAGLSYVTADAAVLMDADLQHPPELIAEFVEKWRAGYDVVYGQRRDRDADTPDPSLGGAGLLCRVPEHERHHAAARRRRLPAARPQGGRRHEPHARARQVQQGAVRLDGLPLDRRALRRAHRARATTARAGARGSCCASGSTASPRSRPSRCGCGPTSGWRPRCSPSATPWSS